MDRRIALALACPLALAGPSLAADLARRPSMPQVLFAPTTPVGVASELPRSPLTDLVSEALPRFASIAAAHRHCPDDIVVWVAFGSNVYRLDRAQPADPQEPGAYLCQADAATEGDRPMQPGSVTRR